MYLVLDDGPPGFPQGFSSPMVLGILLRPRIDFAHGAITLFGHPSQSVWLSIRVPYRSPATPTDESVGLDSTRFARRYLGYLFFDFYSWRY